MVGEGDQDLAADLDRLDAAPFFFVFVFHRGLPRMLADTIAARRKLVNDERYRSINKIQQ
jgi:hypothetical protein